MFCGSVWVPLILITTHLQLVQLLYVLFPWLGRYSCGMTWYMYGYTQYKDGVYAVLEPATRKWHKLSTSCTVLSYTGLRSDRLNYNGVTSLSSLPTQHLLVLSRSTPVPCHPSSQGLCHMALVELSTFLPPPTMCASGHMYRTWHNLRNLSGKVRYTVNSPGRHLASPLLTIFGKLTLCPHHRQAGSSSCLAWSQPRALTISSKNNATELYNPTQPLLLAGQSTSLSFQQWRILPNPLTASWQNNHIFPRWSDGCMIWFYGFFPFS